MALFKKNAEVNDEKMVERLTALALKDADGLLAARSEIVDMVENAIDDYLEAAEKYRDGIREEAAKRVERWDDLEAQKNAQEDKVKAAEAKLGAALVSGTPAEQDAAEAEIAAIHVEIGRIDDRIRIFKDVRFSLAGSGKLAAVEKKHDALLDTVERANKIMDAVNAAFDSHLKAYKDAAAKMYAGYPSNIAGSFGLVNTNFKPSGLDLTELRRLSSDDLTITDIIGM